VTKNFTSSTDVDNTATSGTYASLQAGGGAVTKIQPDTFADLSFDLDVVGETDVKESIIVDLKK
jgi:hypothetical protein